MSLATLTARLHDAGFVHQDFHPGNILVRIGDDDQPHLAMIDLDALRVTRPVWHSGKTSRGSRRSIRRAAEPPLTWAEASTTWRS